MKLHEPWWMGTAQEQACDLCTAGKTVEGERCCSEPRAVGEGHAPVPVRLVRAYTGACGPEASYLDFPGLNP